MIARFLVALSCVSLSAAVAYAISLELRYVPVTFGNVIILLLWVTVASIGNTTLLLLLYNIIG